MSSATPPATKPLLQSKTAWVMAIAFVAGFIPAAQEWIEKNPVPLLQALAAVGLLLRWVTSGKLTIFASDDDSSGGMGVPTGGQGKDSGAGVGTGARMDHKQRTQALPWLVVSGCAALALFLATGCTPAQLEAFKATPITIGIEGEHGSYAYSSKSGLSVSAKLPRVREEKAAPDFARILEREWGEGRYAPGPLAEWPPIERKPRRLVLP